MTAPILYHDERTVMPFNPGEALWGLPYYQDTLRETAGQLWEREAERDTSDPLRLDGAQEDSRQTEIDFLRGPLIARHPYWSSGKRRPGSDRWSGK
jgi:hypothetical protein